MKQCSILRALLTLGLVLGSLGVPYAHSQPVLDDEHLLVVEVRYNNFQLVEGLFIYQQPDYTLIPLQAICDALGFAITVDSERMQASGWFFDEQKSFQLDASQKQLYVAGKHIPWNKNTIIVSDGFDSYVSIKKLEEWLSINLDLRTQLM